MLFSDFTLFFSVTRHKNNMNMIDLHLVVRCEHLKALKPTHCEYSKNIPSFLGSASKSNIFKQLNIKCKRNIKITQHLIIRRGRCDGFKLKGIEMETDISSFCSLLYNISMINSPQVIKHFLIAFNQFSCGLIIPAHSTCVR